jgi:hypothetical protein
MPATIGRLKWDESGEHLYTTGISQGVLYVGSVNASTGAVTWGTGVAWNGLISVSEAPDGADANDFYADNIKYLSLRGVENFGGTITCYQTPEEFDTCDGTATVATGLRIGQQTRMPFCLVYKTQIGNDVAGDDYGYEIHIVYNATASPSNRDIKTINDSPEPAELSYEFKCNPIKVTGHKRTALATLRSTDYDTPELQTKLTTIEDSLFGKSTWEGTTETKVSDPIILTPDEIKAIITGT